MKQKTQFQSENIMMSVVGHLLLVVLLISSFAVVVERAKLVTPNRIEIIEIDLKNVKVSGNETRLYNTSVPRQNEDEKTPFKMVKLKLKQIKKQKTIKLFKIKKLT